MPARTHGQSNSPTYLSWVNMIQRCTNPNHPDYHLYGGRGITPCKRWLGFQAFLDDMGERPPGTTLDRRRVSHGYTMQNCRWATQREQSLNKRTTVYDTINGVTKTRYEWCEEYGIPYPNVRQRIHLGWDPIKAITTPLKWSKS